MHTSRPWSSVQFHPEARAGPYDTSHVFQDFLDKVMQCKRAGKLIGYSFVRSKHRVPVKRVLILGSGGLSILLETTMTRDS